MSSLAEVPSEKPPHIVQNKILQAKTKTAAFNTIKTHDNNNSCYQHETILTSDV